MKPNKRLLLLLLTMIMSVAMLVPAMAAAPSVNTHAEAAALIDVTSGRILYSKNGDKKLRIASLTKIMTAIVAIEYGTLSDKVKTSINAYGVEGSSIYLKLGEEMSLHHLLYGLMLRSGNDAATAIAEHVGGSVDGFVRLMNEKAEQIGMTSSSFKNPHGLDADGHLSSANDMARLTAYALQNPVFRDIVKTPSIKVPNPYEKWDHLWRNKNKMLHLYDGADGVKTGYTKTAKRCLVSSATRDGQQLAAVTLNDGDDWADHARMLDYGFANFQLHPFYHTGEKFPGTELYSPYDFTYPLATDEVSQVTYSLKNEPPTTLSGKLGIRAVAEYRLQGEVIGRLPLYEHDHPALKSNDNSRHRGQSASSEPEIRIRDHPIVMMRRLLTALFQVSGD